jgi:hypothetical protein
MTDIIERANADWLITAQLTQAMTPYRDGLPPLLRRPDAVDTLILPPLPEPAPVREPVTVVYRTAGAEPVAERRPALYRGRRRRGLPFWADLAVRLGANLVGAGLGTATVLFWAVTR